VYKEDGEPIMISALEHYSYCPRQCALIHVEQAFDENVFTMRGHAAHDRVDEPGHEQTGRVSDRTCFARLV
jgi:CRISPR-associated exonuclease Cas4